MPDEETPTIADIEISEELIRREREAQEAMRELEERVLEHSNNELERMFVRAIHKGHDYLDVQVDQYGNVDYVGWDEGHEPPYGWLDEPLDRFDLRGVTYEDIRRAHEQHR